MTTNETYTLSLHDALPIWTEKQCHCFGPDEGEQHVDSGRSSDESRGFQNATVGLPSCFRLRDGSDRLHCCHGFRGVLVLQEPETLASRISVSEHVVWNRTTDHGTICNNAVVPDANTF